MVLVYTEEEYKNIGMDSEELSDMTAAKKEQKDFYEQVKAVWPSAQYLHLFIDYCESRLTYVKTSVGMKQGGMYLMFSECGGLNSTEYRLRRIDSVTETIRAMQVDELEARHEAPKPMKRITKKAIQKWVGYQQEVFSEIKRYAAKVEQAKQRQLEWMNGENIIWSDSAKRRGHIRRNGLVFHFTFTGDGRMEAYTEIDSQANTSTYEAFCRMAQNNFQTEE